MTLRNHRSTLLPDISMGGDGSMFVTDTGGTFPLRKNPSAKDNKPHLRDTNDNFDSGFDAAEVTSYRSYDPRREKRQSQYRQREPSRFRREVETMSADTWGSSKASINRKKPRLNRLKRAESLRKREERHKTFDSTSSGGSGSSRRKPRIRGGIPNRQAFEKRMAHSLSRKEIEEIKRLNKKTNFLSNGNAPFGSLRKQGVANGKLFPGVEERKKKLADDKVPGISLLIAGIVTLLTAAVRLCITWWHLYYCPLWSAALVFVQGVIGVLHRKDYLTRWKNGLYMAVGTLAALAAGATSGFLLLVLKPLLTGVVLRQNATEMALAITLTNQQKSLLGFNSISTLTVVECGLDLALLLLSLVNFYSLTGVLICLSNHWDARYQTTGEVSLAQASGFVALLNVFLRISQREIYWSPVACCGLVMIAASVTICHCKRVDLILLAYAAAIFQFIAIAGLGAAIVFCTLVLVDDVSYLSQASLMLDTVRQGEGATAVATGVAFLFCMVVNLVYAAGTLLRLVRRLCCANWDVTNQQQDEVQDTYM